MDIIPNKEKHSAEELPEGFAYPSSFEACQAGTGDSDLEPWGFTADADADERYGRRLEMKIVMFAQAFHEDMIACFVVENRTDPKVLVLNPWADELIGDTWQPVCKILEEFPNFSDWLEWARNSDLVKMYAEVRAERERRGK